MGDLSNDLVKVCEKPISEKEIHALNIQLIDYVLAEKLPDHPEPTTISYVENGEVGAITAGAFPFAQVENTSYSESEWFDRILSSKIFAKHPTEKMRLRFAQSKKIYNFPTKVDIVSATTTNKYGSFGGMQITLRHNIYFTATISIFPLGSVKGLPSRLRFYFPEEKKLWGDIRTYIYRVEMEARFNRHTSNGNVSKDYQDWTNNLFYRIRTIFSDESITTDVRNIY